MKKRIFLLCLGVFFHPGIHAQKFPVAIGPSVNFAIGNFTTTHSFGIGIEASSAKHWFELKKGKKLRLTWKGGFAYYFGKKVTTSGFSNKYPGYSFVHAYPGLQYISVKKTAFRLFSGPGISLYNGSTRFVLGSELDFIHLLKQNISAGPSILIMKESGADPIWSFGVKTLFKL